MIVLIRASKRIGLDFVCNFEVKISSKVYFGFSTACNFFLVASRDSTSCNFFLWLSRLKPELRFLSSLLFASTSEEKQTERGGGRDKRIRGQAKDDFGTYLVQFRLNNLRATRYI